MDLRYLVTADGLKKIKEELKVRLTRSRKEIADKLEIATAQGDLSENAAYTSALEEQQMNEAKISELSDFVKNATVVVPKNDDIVEIGETVTLLDMDTDMQSIFELVGEEESDPSKNKLSVKSPLGASLLNKKVGSKVILNVRAGKKIYKIISTKS